MRRIWRIIKIVLVRVRERGITTAISSAIRVLKYYGLLGLRHKIRSLVGSYTNPGTAACGQPRRFAEWPWSVPMESCQENGGHFDLLFVGHEASRSGAPKALLEMAKEFARRPDFSVWVCSMTGGLLEEEFQQSVRYLNILSLAVSRGWSDQEALCELLSSFRNQGPLYAVIVNTVAVPNAHNICGELNIPVLSWVHELPRSIEECYGGSATMREIVENSKRIIVPAQFCKDILRQTYGIDEDKIRVAYYGVKVGRLGSKRERARKEVRKELGIPEDSLIVLACGLAGLRKGTDLFVDVARHVLNLGKSKHIHFIWVGDAQSWNTDNRYQEDAGPFYGYVKFVGETPDPERYFVASDVFLLSSREDPCPLVSMEAIEYGLPVIAFDGAGGAPELFKYGFGVVVPYLDTQRMARETIRLLSFSSREKSHRRVGALSKELSWDRCAESVMGILRADYGFHPTRRRKRSARSLDQGRTG
ncbi:MAG: glycosyltransferase family 4 protein [Pseudomonadota bacterium]